MDINFCSISPPHLSPNQVKEIVTSKRTIFLILTMVTYQTVLIFLAYLYPGPPYDVASSRRKLFVIISYSVPSFICFCVVLVSTAVLVIKLKQNLEWRNKAAKQSNINSENSKEMKAVRCVAAICTIFIICFTPNVALFVTGFVYPKFNQHDPILGTLMIVLHAIGTMLQVLSSAVNIFVYYRMSTKYREILKAMFYRKRDIAD